MPVPGRHRKRTNVVRTEESVFWEPCVNVKSKFLLYDIKWHARPDNSKRKLDTGLVKKILNKGDRVGLSQILIDGGFPGCHLLISAQFCIKLTAF